MKSGSAPSAALDALLVLSSCLAHPRPRRLLEDALDLLLTATGATAGAAYRVHERLELVACAGMTPELASALTRLPLDGEAWFIAQRAARLGHPLIEDGIGHHTRGPLEARAFVTAGWHRVVASPVVRRGAVMGVLVLAASEELELAEHPTLELLSIASRMLACAMSLYEASPSQRMHPSNHERFRHTTPPLGSSSPGVSSLYSTRRSTPMRVEPALQDTQHDDSSPLSARCRELTSVAQTIADMLRREGPMRGSQIVSLLRGRGMAEPQALSVISFALSTGIFARDPEKHAYLKAVNAAPATRILLVDDDDELRGIVRRVLEGEGYTVETAENGLVALHAMHRRPADIVLLDLKMPVMDGWQLLRLIESDPALARTPVVLITGDATSLTKSSLLCLRKPLDHDKLVGSIERMKARAS